MGTAPPAPPLSAPPPTIPPSAKNPIAPATTRNGPASPPRHAPPARVRVVPPRGDPSRASSGTRSGCSRFGLRRQGQAALLEHQREPSEPSTDALPRVLLAAHQPPRDLRVGQLFDHPEPQRLAMVLTQRSERLRDRAADRREVD